MFNFIRWDRPGVAKDIKLALLSVAGEEERLRLATEALVARNKVVVNVTCRVVIERGPFVIEETVRIAKSADLVQGKVDPESIQTVGGYTLRGVKPRY